MGSKEVMVSAPIMVLLYDRIFVGERLATILRQRWGLYAGLAATWGILAWLTLSSGNRGTTAGFGLAISPWAYLATQFGAVVRYLFLCVWPRDLVFDYGVHLAHGAAEIVPQALIVMLLLAGTAAALRWRPVLGFLGLWFFLILAPTSSIVPVTTQTIAEHRMYLPLAAVVTLVVVGGWRLGQAWPGRRADVSGSGWRQVVVPVVLLAVAAGALGVRTWQRNAVLVNPSELWDLTLRQRPDNYRLHSVLGLEAFERRDYALAETRFTRTIELKPDFWPAYYNRGRVYQALGRPYDALADYGRAIAAGQDVASACNNRGMIYNDMARYAAAITDFDRAIQLSPRSAAYYSNRGIAYHALGQFEPAIADFSAAIELRPNFAVYYS
jgi:protein O-mannosyl-transferase